MNEKLSNSLKSSPLAKAHLARLHEDQRGKCRTEEEKQSISNGQRARWSGPDAEAKRQAVSERMKAVWAKRKAMLEAAAAILDNDHSVQE